jgi:hypothetical protein
VASRLAVGVVVCFSAASKLFDISSSSEYIVDVIVVALSFVLIEGSFISRSKEDSTENRMLVT